MKQFVSREVIRIPTMYNAVLAYLLWQRVYEDGGS